MIRVLYNVSRDRQDKGNVYSVELSGWRDGMSSIGRLHGLCWENNDLRIIYLAEDANKQLIIFVIFVTRKKKQKLKC